MWVVLVLGLLLTRLHLLCTQLQKTFLDAFWGSAAITAIFSPEHTALHVQPGRVPTSAGSRAAWAPLLVPAVGGGVSQQGQARGKSPLLVSAGKKASKDLGEVWEAWLQERWRGTGGGASELGLAPHGAGCCRCTGWGEAGRKGGYGSSWGGWGMSLNVP